MKAGSFRGGGGSFAHERRREPRIHARIEVRFQDSSQAAVAFRAYSLNLSVGGICLRTRKKYAIGSELTIFVRIESDEYRFAGVVAWERRGAIGVRFKDLATEDHQRLSRLVALFAPSGL